VLVGNGLYQEALDLQSLWAEPQRQAGKKRRPLHYAFYLLNTAEALDNLGRTDAALKVIADVQALRLTEPIVVVGSICSQCWILARSGQAAAAQSLADRIEPNALGPRYAAEAHYTRAVISMECGDLDSARNSIRDGQACALRSASIRNGQLLQAEHALRSGDRAGAIHVFERALASRYRGQGGFWLSLFAKFYELEERTEDAPRIRAVLARRDRQFADTARGTSWLTRR
jgi:hypothetical protein